MPSGHSGPTNFSRGTVQIELKVKDTNTKVKTYEKLTNNKATEGNKTDQNC